MKETETHLHSYLNWLFLHDFNWEDWSFGITYSNVQSSLRKIRAKVHSSLKKCLHYLQFMKTSSYSPNLSKLPCFHKVKKHCSQNEWVLEKIKTLMRGKIKFHLYLCITTMYVSSFGPFLFKVSYRSFQELLSDIR